jgi:hypothetical protein
VALSTGRASVGNLGSGSLDTVGDCDGLFTVAGHCIQVSILDLIERNSVLVFVQLVSTCTEVAGTHAVECRETTE